MLISTRFLLSGLLFLGSLLDPVVLAARSSATPVAAHPRAEDRFDVLAGLKSAKLGTDRLGHLWAWDPGASTVEVFDPDGVRVARLEVPELRSLDVDRTWGVVGTPAGGSSLELVAASGTARTIPLENAAAYVAWIDAETVALSTSLAAEKFELWDVGRGFRTRSFGPTEEIIPRPGAVLQRSFILRYSVSRDRLLALDSVNGVLEWWTLEGEIVRKDAFPARRRAEIEAWLADFDRDAKARGQSYTPSYEVLRLAEDAEGSVWVVAHCNSERDRASLKRFSDEPAPDLELELSEPCCSNNFTIWNNYFISARNARREFAGCAIWRKLP